MRYQIVATRKSQTTWLTPRVIVGVLLSGGGYYTKEAAVQMLNAGNTMFTYVGGVVAEVRVHHLNGWPYLISEADKTTANNLLSLPDC